MSMICFWIPVTPAEAEALRAGSTDPWDLLEELDRSVDVDKDWHGLHAVLTGSAEEVDTALGLVVFGGEDIGEDGGYGPPRLLTPELVKAASEAMQELGLDGFTARIDPAALTAMSIYPGGWDDAPEDTRECLSGSFSEVTDLFARAAADGRAMVIALS